MASAMRTAALQAPRHFAIVSRPLSVAGSDEWRVRNAATAACPPLHVAKALAACERNPGRVLRIDIHGREN